MEAAVYIGVDFHAAQQTLCYLKTEDGEIRETRLCHRKDDLRHDEVREFYVQFKSKVIVGIEAGGCTDWFEDLLAEMGIEVWVGESKRIRKLAVRKQKNDKLDAAHILDLMTSNRFPRLHRRSKESNEVLRQLGYRNKLVKMRTMLLNSLRAIGRREGLLCPGKVDSRRGQARMKQLKVSASSRKQIEEMYGLILQLNVETRRIEKWLETVANNDEDVKLLMTQKGVGLLTALVVAHSIRPISRFANGRAVTAFIGLDPVENSSGSRKRIGAISKQGSPLARHLLQEAGQVAIRWDQGLKKFYERIKARRGGQKAKVAVARKLLVRLYIMLRDGIDAEEFNRRGVEARSSRIAHSPEVTRP